VEDARRGRGMERATETKQRWAGCTQKGNPLPFCDKPLLPLTQATLVRGAFVFIARVRPLSHLIIHAATSREAYAHSAVCIELSQSDLCLFKPQNWRVKLIRHKIKL